MASKILQTLSLTAILLASIVASAPFSKRTCVSPYHIIVARGTDQAPGTGSMGEMADQMLLFEKSAIISAVDYPATMENPTYMASVKIGTVNLQNMITNIVDRCPDAKIALLGYSQGANVVADAIGGSTENANDVAPLADKYTDNVKAIILTGDPTHNGQQKFTWGTGHNNGQVPRIENFALHPYSDKTISFCDAGDPICDSGDDMSVHWSYETNYKVAGAYFGLSKLWAAN